MARELPSVARDHDRDALDLSRHRIAVDDDLRHDGVLAGWQLAVEVDLKNGVCLRMSDAGKDGPTLSVDHHVPALRRRALEHDRIDGLHWLALDAVVAHELDLNFDVG